MKRYNYKEYIAHIFPCMYYGIICGAITGALIFLFKLCAKKAEEISHYLYNLASNSPLTVALTFVVLILCGLLMYTLHKKVPECMGGGIPRSEGVLRGVLYFRHIPTLFATFFGSVLSFLCGLPLGSEGPAVLMGTCVGKLCVSNKQSTWSRYVMTGGAGAGFAVATGAPLSGILFALEEIHKRFTPMLVLSVSASVITATYTNRALCQLFSMDANLLHIEQIGEYSLEHGGYLLLLGVIIALAVGIFDASISIFRNITSKFKRVLTPAVKLVCVFVLAGVLVFTFADSVYSGHHTIIEIASEYKPWLYLAAIFAVRLLMMLFITDSGATGGIFIPTLAIGCAGSALAAKLLCNMGMPRELFTVTVILGMCAFIGGTLRAPLTSSVLFLELTGEFTNLLFVALVIFTVSFITEIFNLKPFYDIALENMEHKQNKGKQPVIACFEMKVAPDAFVVGKTVRDIMWPHSSVVISVKRADESNQDMDNDGEKKLYAEDTLVLRAKFYDEDEIRNLLKGLVGDKYDIVRTEV